MAIPWADGRKMQHDLLLDVLIPSAKRLADAEKPPEPKAELPGIRLSDSYPVQSQAVSSTKSLTPDNNT